MRRLSCAFALTVAAAFAPFGARAAAPQSPPTIIKDGKLDLIKLHVPKLAAVADVPVFVRRFSVEGVNIGTGAPGGKEDAMAEAARIQKEGPDLFATACADRLKKLAYFTKVELLDAAVQAPAQAIVIEGRFTILDPGDNRKRHVVGMGSGKTTTAIEGQVKDGGGQLLAEFVQDRFGATAKGNGIDLLIKDSKSLGEDVANFLDAWARGKSIK